MVLCKISFKNDRYCNMGGTYENYIFGYARVSTESQNLDRQLDALQKYGVNHIYNEKMTGTKKDRPELSKMLDRMTTGDTIVIEYLSRLGRSTKDLIELTELFHAKGVNLISLKESIDTNTSTGKSINGLAAIVEGSFGLDPFSDALFVFCNKSRDRVKILEWDGDG